MVPKSENAEEIRTICNKSRALLGGNNETFEVIPLIETAKGIQFAYSVASADPMISRMAFGSIDFSLDIDCELTSDGLELLHARSQIVIASRAAGIGAPIDAVYPDLQNDSGLEKEAKNARQLGFKAKLIIHPKQIETVHRIYSPSIDEINRARMIVNAFEESEKNGVASIRVNNMMVDYPVYKKAKELLLLSSSHD